MRRACLLALFVLAAWTLATAPARAATDPGLSQQWGLPMIGAPDAWATGTGANITIAVVDTGVDLQHVDLKDKLVPGKNFIDPAKSPQDDNGHGTHVAGIAAAATNNGQGVAGVAPDARIMPLKALAADGTGPSSAVEAAVRYAADQRVPIINLSLGDAGIRAVLGPSFGQAIEYAWGKGSICVISSGNTDNTEYEFITGPNFSSQNAMIVTSLTRQGTKPAYARDVRFAKWGIAAPGGGAVKGQHTDDILSTWWLASQPNAYAFVAGTSMAAPHVSGALAVLLSLGQTPQQAVDRLNSTARDVGPAGKDTVYGFGALDLKAAVAGLRPAGGTTGSPGTPTTSRGGTGTTQRGSGAATPTTAGTGTTAAPPGDIPIVEAPDGQTEGGDNSTEAGADDEDDDDSATAAGRGNDDGTGSNGDDGDKPWAAAVLALLALAGVTALLPGAIRPKPT